MRKNWFESAVLILTTTRMTPIKKAVAQHHICVQHADSLNQEDTNVRLILPTSNDSREIKNTYTDV